MYERSTNSNEPEKAQAIHTTTETSDPQRMGTDRQRCGGSPEAADSQAIIGPMTADTFFLLRFCIPFIALSSSD